MRHGLVLSTVLLLASASACARAPLGEVESPRPLASAKPASVASNTSAAAAPERKVGDYWVHRISGSFSSKPMMLIERVVSVDETSITIEYTLEDSEGQSQLQVTRERSTDQIISVMHLVGGVAEPGSIADFDALIARTTFAPDSNEGYVDRTLATCLVGPSELDCETKSYRVMVGAREASLDITRSDKYPGRDIGGEITATDGEVIYRAELLEAGNESSDSGVASAR
jgi:hypothetical protein